MFLFCFSVEIVQLQNSIHYSLCITVERLFFHEAPMSPDGVTPPCAATCKGTSGSTMQFCYGTFCEENPKVLKVRKALSRVQ